MPRAVVPHATVMVEQRHPSGPVMTGPYTCTRRFSPQSFEMYAARNPELGGCAFFLVGS
jgi:hypothetical protein